MEEIRNFARISFSEFLFLFARPPPPSPLPGLYKKHPRGKNSFGCGVYYLVLLVGKARAGLFFVDVVAKI